MQVTEKIGLKHNANSLSQTLDNRFYFESTVQVMGAKKLD